MSLASQKNTDNVQKYVAFRCTNNEISKIELKKKHLKSHQKIKVPRNKLKTKALLINKSPLINKIECYSRN